MNLNVMLIGIVIFKNVGWILGFGWGFGYFGGIIVLVIVVVFDMFDWFGMFIDGGFVYCFIVVGCVVWVIVFSILIFLNVLELFFGCFECKVGFFVLYLLLVKDVIGFYCDIEICFIFWYLLVSVVFCDGLGGVFVFGVIIGIVVFYFGM